MISRTHHLVLVLSLGGALTAANAASTAYRNLVLGDGAVVYYEFDETSGTTAVDSVAGSNGTYTGAVNLGVTGNPGLGTAADLVGGYIEVPNAGSFATSSIETWIQVDNLAGGCCTSVASAGTWTTNALHWNLKSDFAFEHAVNSQGNVNTAAGSLVADGSTWYHLVVTQDAGVTNWYVNGVLTPDNGDHAGPIDYGNTNFQIGAWNGDRLLDGRIDEFAIYDTALTDAQVLAHYNAGVVPEPTASLLLLLGAATVGLRRRRK